MHIYAFGSVCRGDVTPESDVDLLAIVDAQDARFSPDEYSIYSYSRLVQIWRAGNPFAWHLSTEARLLYSSNGVDVLFEMGEPSRYTNCVADCQKFYALFCDAVVSITSQSETEIYDLSVVFLAARNFATCFSLGHLEAPDFSRHSARRLGRHSLTISPEQYDVFERSRILSTRGTGASIGRCEIVMAVEALAEIESWMRCLLEELHGHAAGV
jgi:hypothetical protein